CCTVVQSIQRPLSYFGRLHRPLEPLLLRPGVRQWGSSAGVPGSGTGGQVGLCKLAIPGGPRVMNRADAYALLTEYTKNPNLIKPMVAREAARRRYARKLGEAGEKGGVVGLLHDFDYERWPDPPDHPLKGAEILRQRGYPEDVIYAIKSHADYLPDCPRVHRLDKALYACDELAGLLTAAALVRPAGITDQSAASVKKKMKSKGCARGVKREDVERGAADFGVDLTEHIQFVIDAMKPHAAALGLERGAGGEPDSV